MLLQPVEPKHLKGLVGQVAMLALDEQGRKVPGCQVGPRAAELRFPPVCVCCLETTLCIECSLFSHFFFQGQFKLSKYKNHLVRVHKLAIILSCMCVFVRSGWEVSGWPVELFGSPALGTSFLGGMGQASAEPSKIPNLALSAWASFLRFLRRRRSVFPGG